MAIENSAANLNKNSAFQGIIASKDNASIIKTGEGRIYVVIDGVKYSADRNDLFNMNSNPSEWLERYVKDFYKEAKKHDFNDVLKKKSDKIEEKMAENDAEVKKSRNLQERIKAAIKGTQNALKMFLAECGVNSRSMLSGEQKAHADSLYGTYWEKRFSLTSESNREYSLLSDNCSLAFDKGKAEREIAFNSITLDDIYS